MSGPPGILPTLPIPTPALHQGHLRLPVGSCFKRATFSEHPLNHAAKNVSYIASLCFSDPTLTHYHA